jgi:3-oxoacyl-[acyl-carrier-protein] synthase II
MKQDNIQSINNNKPVCITGIGICLPLSDGKLATLNALLEGKNGIQTVRSFDGSQLTSSLVSEFDPENRNFGLTDEELNQLDRGTWFALAALSEAIRQAGFIQANYPTERVGVVVGTSHAGIQHIERIYQAVKQDMPVDFQWLEAASTDHTATVVANHLNARGPKATISSACASSNTAVGVGLDWLLNDEADCVIVIGTDTISPSILAGFNALRAVSLKPAAPFSTPPGITLGEGAGVVILEREHAAHSRQIPPLAWIRGYALSGDAYHETAADTQGKGIEAAMVSALNDAGLSGFDIDYVSAHGTGTDANDIPEALATERVVGAATPISSPKSFLGHTLGASGVIELIITLLFADRNLVPPTKNFKEARTGCPPLNYVPNQPQILNVNNFLCNNYGFGGNNSSLVISRKSSLCARSNKEDSVAIVGIGAIGAFGSGVHGLIDSLWTHNLPVAQTDKNSNLFLSAKEVVSKLKLPGNSRASTMIRCAIAAVGEALETSGCQSLIDESPLQCALISGVSHGAIKHVEKLLSSVFDEGIQYASATHFPLTTMNATGGQISIAYGIKGYNTTFCGAGAALHFASQLVKDGRQDRAISFSADELSPLVLSLLKQHNILSPDTLAYPGESAAALVLERGSIAEKRGANIMATLAGIVCTQPGHCNDWGETLKRSALLVLSKAQVAINDIAAVLTIEHGPKVLQYAENKSISDLFYGETQPPILSAARVTGLTPSSLLMMHIIIGAEILSRRTLPPTAAGQKSTPIQKGSHILILHPALGGECHAVLIKK